MKSIEELNIKIFADGADLTSIVDLYQKNYIKGFTTNPTLMRKAGIYDYKAFALEVLQTVRDRPISFEVFSDDFDEMHAQALEIASWGDNVYVKIPVTNTKSVPSYRLIRELANSNVKQNVTAVMTFDQIQKVVDALALGPAAYVSVFAGRIADTGEDPIDWMKYAMELLQPYPQLQLIWASPRELLNIFQAEAIGCHVITATHDILKKLPLIGKNLAEYSLETVKMFYEDAKFAGFNLNQTIQV